jgi:hypothetical protein
VKGHDDHENAIHFYSGDWLLGDGVRGYGRLGADLGEQ